MVIFREHVHPFTDDIRTHLSKVINYTPICNPNSKLFSICSCFFEFVAVPGIDDDGGKWCTPHAVFRRPFVCIHIVILSSVADIIIILRHITTESAFLSLFKLKTKTCYYISLNFYGAYRTYYIGIYIYYEFNRLFILYLLFYF